MVLRQRVAYLLAYFVVADVIIVSPLPSEECVELTTPFRQPFHMWLSLLYHDVANPSS